MISISDLRSSVHTKLNRYLLKKMFSDYGTYRLVFEPPTDQLTPRVEMTLSGEADLSQMLAFFEAFLQASGYQLGEKSLELTGPDTLKVDKEGFISFSDYPMAVGSGVDFIGFGDK